jgi:hypothetical protein
MNRLQHQDLLDEAQRSAWLKFAKENSPIIASSLDFAKEHSLSEEEGFHIACILLWNRYSKMISDLKQDT